MIREIVEGALLITGCLFMLLASLGILRMPDLFTRLQVTSKASVFGMTCILSSAAVHFADPAVTLQMAVIIAFVVLTVPVSTHMLARAGYTTSVPFTRETVVNDLAGQYDPTTHTLSGQEPTTREFSVNPRAFIVGKRVADLGLPAGVLILAILRGDATIVPKGPTVLEARDILRVLVEPKLLDQVRSILESRATDDSPDERES